jgi:hypothetical protein
VFYNASLPRKKRVEANKEVAECLRKCKAVQDCYTRSK